ncbi:MAG TPA: glycosyltransferase family 4 protein [Longimicrobiales bacterium]
MRVVLSTPRAGWGGTATLARSLAGGLQARGHDVVIFCKPESEIHRSFRDHFACEPVLHGVDFPPPAILRCRQAFRRHATQVVLSLLHMDLRLTAAAARLSGIRVVAHRAELAPFSRLPHRRFLIDRLPHHWVANSAANRDVMLASAPWLRPQDVTMIHNGIDAEPYAAAEPAALGLHPDSIAVAYVGRLVIEKGLPELAAAWRRIAPDHPALHLIIAGIGGYEQAFREQLGDAPRVHWLGYRRDVAAIMKAADIVVVPSWEEPFGIVALEAMAAGRPVIATCAGGLVEVVEEGVTGRLVPARDAGALASAIVGLAGDAEARTRMGDAGLARVRERFGEEAMIDAYEAVLAREASIA